MTTYFVRLADGTEDRYEEYVYCGNCGARDAQRADECSECGYANHDVKEGHGNATRRMFYPDHVWHQISVKKKTGNLVVRLRNTKGGEDRKVAEYVAGSWLSWRVE